MAATGMGGGAGRVGGSRNGIADGRWRQEAWETMDRWSGNGGVATGGERRFGIDVGVPEELGLRQTRWWEVRRRLRARGVRQ